MLFQVYRPYSASLSSTGKVALVTKHKLILSSIQHFSQQTTAILAYPCSEKVMLKISENQILVAGDQAIEIYQANRNQQLQILQVFALNGETFFSVDYDCAKWNVYGEIYQYSQCLIEIKAVERCKSHGSICFAGPNQFYLNHRNELHKKNHMNFKLQKVTCKQLPNILSSLQGQKQDPKVSAVEGDGVTLLNFNGKWILALGSSQSCIQAQFKNIINMWSNFVVDRIDSQTIQITKFEVDRFFHYEVMQWPSDMQILSIAAVGSDIVILTICEGLVTAKKFTVNGLNSENGYHSNARPKLVPRDFVDKVSPMLESQMDFLTHSEGSLQISQENQSGGKREQQRLCGSSVVPRHVSQFQISNSKREEQSKKETQKVSQNPQTGPLQKLQSQVPADSPEVPKEQESHHSKSPQSIDRQEEVLEVIEVQQLNIEQSSDCHKNLKQSLMEIPNSAAGWSSSKEQLSPEADEEKSESEIYYRQFIEKKLSNEEMIGNFGSRETGTVQEDTSSANDQQRKKMIFSKDISAIAAQSKSDTNVEEPEGERQEQDDEETIELGEEVEELPIPQSEASNEQILKYIDDEPGMLGNNEVHTQFLGPITPGFNQEVLDGQQPTDHWNRFEATWDARDQDHPTLPNLAASAPGWPAKVNFGKDEPQVPKQHSRKVRAFAKNQTITREQEEEIQGKKYTLLMREVFTRSEELFNELMKEFLSEIISEQQSRLFFAEYIRSFSGKTRDFLIRLYMSIEDTPQHRTLMTRALSEFKLCEVPEICLAVDRSILDIFKVLYPSVYVEDLCSHSQNLIRLLLQNYFSTERFCQEQISIEDETIDITHPRNILNVILYLNESYELPMEILFEVYCEELIKNGCTEIVHKMLHEEKTFEICEVSKSILDEIVERNAIEKLRESFTYIGEIEQTLCLLTEAKRKEMVRVLEICDYLNLNDIYFKIDLLFKISYSQSAFSFCSTLIRENTSKKLMGIQIVELYAKLYSLIYKQRLIFYTQELKDLCQIMVEKYFYDELYAKAFELLAPIVSLVKRGFIAKILYKHLDSKLINRLCNKNFSEVSFRETFSQFFNSKAKLIKRNDFLRDKFQIAEHACFYNCSQTIFMRLYQKSVSNPSLQVTLVCYVDYLLAGELCVYHVIEKKEWNQFCDSIEQYIPESFRKQRGKNIGKFNSRVKIPLERDDSDQSVSTSYKNFDLLSKPVDKKVSDKLTRSLQQIELDSPGHLKSDQTKPVHRSKSDPRLDEDEIRGLKSDRLLDSLSTEVDKDSILFTLEKIYCATQESHNKVLSRFLIALTLIDRQRIEIHHYESLKALVGMELNFDIRSIIPFSAFRISQKDKCLESMIPLIEKKIGLQSFWVIYTTVEIMLEKGERVALLMIGIIINCYRDDSLSGTVRKIIQNIQIDAHEVPALIQAAEAFGLIGIAEELKNHAFEIRETIQ